MSDELNGADFGDRRLSQRLSKIGDALTARPDASFPKAAACDAELEGTYRFLSHTKVTAERILAPHVAMTVQRAQVARKILVPHDTTDFCFSTDREGLGRLGESGRGFYAHFALAVAADGTRLPLGVLGLKSMFRHRPAPAKPLPAHRPDSESRRWRDLALEVSQRLGDGVEAIHVMDSEADSYELFAALMAARCRFVIRLRSNHRIEVPQPGAFRLEERLEVAEELFQREVPLSPRKDPKRAKARRAHPPRKQRIAKLSFRAVAVAMRRPDDLRRHPIPETLTVNVIHVHEVDPPPELEPIDWKLVTTESIDDLTQIAASVDHYRARWVIEEFFKALKTGCAVERRQLESSHALLNALAIFAPIAWQLLRLRHFARDTQQRPATEALSPLRIRLLRGHKKIRLPPSPTVREAFLAVAQLGGHIKNNGEPGWIVLGRGFDELLVMEAGALIALGKM
jgi:hypothetical protein